MYTIRSLVGMIVCIVRVKERSVLIMTTESDKQLATAIYTVNRHAKTAIDNKPLYELKKLAIQKMITEKKLVKLVFILCVILEIANSNPPF